MVEADLLRYYGVDYRDRWRGDLSLRRILVLLRGLPPEARTSGTVGPYWSTEAHLLDELRMAMTGSKKKPAKPHPARPLGGKQSKPIDKSRLAAGLKRLRDRQQAIERGEIT